MRKGARQQAEEAAGTLFDELVDRRLKAAGVTCANISSPWKATAARGRLCSDLDRLSGNTVDFESQLERWLSLLKVSAKTTRITGKMFAPFWTKLVRRRLYPRNGGSLAPRPATGRLNHRQDHRPQADGTQGIP